MKREREGESDEEEKRDEGGEIRAWVWGREHVKEDENQWEETGKKQGVKERGG